MQNKNGRENYSLGKGKKNDFDREKKNIKNLKSK